MRSILLGILATILLTSTQLWAQGSDFPAGVWAPAPSWSEVPVLAPGSYGGNWSSGVAAGPYYLSNRRGDTVKVDFVWDWWGLVPVQFVIRTNGDQNMRWDDGGYWWKGMCFQHCTAEFEATGDDTVVWLEFTGVPQFGAHLDFTVIAKPAFSILPDWSKQTYHNIGNFLVGLGAGAAIVASFPCNVGDGLSCAAVNTAGILSGLAGGLLLQVDPWTWYYPYPYDPVWQNADSLGLYYLGGGYGYEFWDTIVYDQNLLVNAAIGIDANLRAANETVDRATSCDLAGDSCADWQKERALEFFEAANSNAYWAAAALWQLAYEYEQQGFGYDYIDLFNQAAGQFWQMYNNGVR